MKVVCARADVFNLEFRRLLPPAVILAYERVSGDRRRVTVMIAGHVRIVSNVCVDVLNVIDGGEVGGQIQIISNSMAEGARERSINRLNILKLDKIIK